MARIEIRNFSKSTLNSSSCDCVCHVKMLNCFSVVQATEGFYEISLDGREAQLVSDGNAFIAPMNRLQQITHHVDPQTGRMAARWIFFHVFMDGIFLEDLYDFPVVFPDPTTPKKLFRALFSTEDPCDEMITAYRFAKALLSIGTAKKNLPEPFLAVLTYIRLHFKEKLKIQDLAAIAHLSEPAFYPFFKRYSGHTAIGYVNALRLAEASEMLKNSTQTVREISDAVGFSNEFYFSKQFKNKYGCSPSLYRRVEL